MVLHRKQAPSIVPVSFAMLLVVIAMLSLAHASDLDIPATTPTYPAVLVVVVVLTSSSFPVS